MILSNGTGGIWMSQSMNYNTSPWVSPVEAIEEFLTEYRSKMLMEFKKQIVLFCSTYFKDDLVRFFFTNNELGFIRMAYMGDSFVTNSYIETTDTKRFVSYCYYLLDNDLLGNWPELVYDCKNGKFIE